MAPKKPRLEVLNPEAQPALAIFPAEIWLQIFKNLDDKTVRKSATWVCRDFHRIIRLDSELSNYLFFKGGIFHDEAMEILKGWPKLKTLRYNGLIDEDWIEEGLFNWKLLKNCEFCPLVEKVMAKTIDDTYRKREIARTAWHQILLQIEEFCIYLNGLDDKDPFSKGFPVKASVLSGSWSPGSEISTNVGNFCKDLEKVDISGMYHYSFRVCESILKASPNVKVIKTFDDERIFKIAMKFCPEIEEITNDGGTNASSFIPYYKIPKLKRLTLLKINFVDLKIKEMTSLRYLYLKNCNLMTRNGFYSAFPNLEELHVLGHRYVLRGKGSVCGFLRIIFQLSEMKQIKVFKWKMNGGYFNVPTSQWARELNIHGHAIVKVFQNLALNCSIDIELKSDIDDNLMSFSKKKGQEDVLWETHLGLVKTNMISKLKGDRLLCKGAPNCDCQTFRED